MRLACSVDGSRIYCMTAKPGATQLLSISRAGSTWAVESTADSGEFLVARESGTIRHVSRPTSRGPGACCEVTSPARMRQLFTFLMPRYAGSLAQSGDGKVCVWRDGAKTRVWKASP